LCQPSISDYLNVVSGDKIIKLFFFSSESQTERIKARLYQQIDDTNELYEDKAGTGMDKSSLDSVSL